MNIFWTKRALSDVSSIQEYYLPLLPKATLLNILDEIENAVILLKNFPEIGKSIDGGGVRKYVLTKFDYNILYTIDSGSINIIRILDTRMNNRIHNKKN